MKLYKSRAGYGLYPIYFIIVKLESGIYGLLRIFCRRAVFQWEMVKSFLKYDLVRKFYSMRVWCIIQYRFVHLRMKFCHRALSLTYFSLIISSYSVLWNMIYFDISDRGRQFYWFYHTSIHDRIIYIAYLTYEKTCYNSYGSWYSNKIWLDSSLLN